MHDQRLPTNHVVWEKVRAIDLESIKFKMIHEEGWSPSQVAYLEREYRRFLYVVLTEPELPVCPTRGIDAFWHFHILDTIKYAEDCRALCGEYLHHFPYFGMRGAEDAENLQVSFAATASVYTREFGDEYARSVPMDVDGDKDVGRMHTPAASFCVRVPGGPNFPNSPTPPAPPAPAPKIDLSRPSFLAS